MRRVALVVVLAANASAALGPAGAAAGPARACALSSGLRAPRLPAPLTIRTRCGAYRIGRSGRIARLSRSFAPVPQGADWSPYTGVWTKVERGRLLVGRWQRTLWRSKRPFPVAYQVGALVVGQRALSFSYGGRAERLYIAPLGGPERRIASGEFPLGWSKGGLYTRRSREGELLLRTSSGVLRQTIARRVWAYAYGGADGSLYFLAHGALFRAQGRSTRRLAALAPLDIASGRTLQIEPLGKLVALQNAKRLVVLRRDGSVYAAVRLPSRSARADDASSTTAAPGAAAVAFTATKGNTAAGSAGSETVYLVRAGSTSARAIHRENVQFAICERDSTLVWHGRWLLYGASEGSLAVIDTRRPQRAIELTRTLRRLPGADGDEGNLDFLAYWTGQPTGT